MLLLRYCRISRKPKKKPNIHRPDPTRGFFVPMSSQPEEIYHLVSKDFQLPEVKEEFSEEKAIEILTKAISQLMDRNLEKLLQICYRVDLSEQKLKEILHYSKPEEVAKDLAQALWDRQKLKVETRRRYSGD